MKAKNVGMNKGRSNSMHCYFGDFQGFIKAGINHFIGRQTLSFSALPAARTLPVRHNAFACKPLSASRDTTQLKVSRGIKSTRSVSQYLHAA